MSKKNGYSTLDNDQESLDVVQPEGKSSIIKQAAVIIIALVFVVAMIILIAVFVARKSTGVYTPTGKLLGFEDIFSGELSARYITTKWLPSGLLSVSNATSGEVSSLDPQTGEKTLIFQKSDIKLNDVQVEYFNYWFSSDQSHVLFASERTKIWRHSFSAVYVVYNIASKQVFALSGTDQLLNAVWSPTGNSIAYVKDNNILYRQIDPLSEPIVVTTDGVLREIFNGIQTWVYEEDVTGSYNALWWSPDSTKIAFLRSNETLVQRISIPYYEDPNVSLYPSQIVIPYPKAGTPNPLVEVKVFNLQDNATSSMDIPFEVESNRWVYAITWVPGSISQYLGISVKNRDQNEERLIISDAISGATENNILTWKAENGWALGQPPLWIDSDRFITIGNNSNHLHIELFNRTSGFEKFLTSGDWEVRQVHKYVQSSNEVYYSSTQVSSVENHVYSVNVDTLEVKRTSVSSIQESEPAYYSANFSPKDDYFILTYTGLKVPLQVVKSFSDDTEFILSNNAELSKTLSGYDMPKEEITTIHVNGNDLNVKFIYPPGFDDGKAEFYPVLLSPYGGPNSQQVKYGLSYGYDQYVSTHLNIVVAVIDNVGTAAKGIQFMQDTYLQLGVKEALDQIEAAKILGQRKEIKADRIAIRGSSFGGLLTLSCLVVPEGSSTFRAGVSVAPVTDWRFYDTAYTERFMLTPQQNPEGYNASSILNKVSNIKTNLLVIHGTADDNVHFQNSAELNVQMVRAGVQYDVMYYANRDHAITGDGAREHYYTYMTSYLKNKLVDS